MASAIRMIGHEEHLSLVDHLDELRTRLIVAGLAFAVAFGVCFWQNAALLRVINAPLEHQTRAQVSAGNGPMGRLWEAERSLRALAHDTSRIAGTLSATGSPLPAPIRADLAAEQARIAADVAAIPTRPQGYNPTTISFGEPFTATVTVTLYFALLVSLPVLLFELYGFVLPAFSPSERRVALPLLLAVPFLFIAGVLFGYYVVLPASVRFFQNFNSGEFNVLVQGSSYYKFAALTLIAMGLVFQVPVAVIGVTRARILTPRQLRKGRRYALVLCALLAAILPGDVVTMVLETLPLYLLYEASVLLASVLERRRAREGTRGPEAGPAYAAAAATGGAGPAGGEQIERSVREMLDHIDPDLHR